MSVSNPRLGLAAVIAAVGAGSWTAGAAPVDREPPLLLGGASSPHPTPVPIDPWLPTGSSRESAVERPAGPVRPACSPRLPVCVHAESAADGARARAALHALENAYERLVRVLELPAPLPDRSLGGSDGLDWYLGAPDTELAVGHDAPELGSWDAAPAFCVGGAGYELDREATRCVAQASSMRLDAAETPDVRAAHASLLWWISGTPDGVDQALIDDAQAHPERAASSGPATALWLAYLDDRLSTQAPGELAGALLATSSGRSAPDARFWDNEPDTFDVLRHSLDLEPGRFASLLASFAASRAFLGTRDDGRHWPALGWSGDFGRVRYDWVIPYSSLPRRVAATRPVEPTGSIYVWLELDRDPGTTPLGFRAQWEPPVTFAWTLIKLARDGSELARIHVPYRQRATSAEQQLNELAGARAVLVVGTNLGGVDLAHPFDPDWAPYEPTGCTVYLTRL